MRRLPACLYSALVARKSLYQFYHSGETFRSFCGRCLNVSENYIPKLISNVISLSAMKSDLSTTPSVSKIHEIPDPDRQAGSLRSQQLWTTVWLLLPTRSLRARSSLQWARARSVYLTWKIPQLLKEKLQNSLTICLQMIHHRFSAFDCQWGGVGLAPSRSWTMD